jgi:hypothetical protein
MKQLKRVIFIMSLLILLIGCGAQRQALKPSSGLIMNNSEKIYVIRSKPPKFTKTTAMGVMTMAALGPIFGTLAGGHYVEMAEGKIDVDPAVRIQERLSESIKSVYSLDNIDIIKEPINIEPDDYVELNNKFEGNVVLGVKTTVWGLVYHPIKWSHYRLTVSATAILSNPQNKEKLWQGSCFYAEPSGTASTDDELVADNASLFQSKLSAAAEECSKQLVEQFSSGK